MSTKHRTHKSLVRQAKARVNNAMRWSPRARRGSTAANNLREPFAPPEDWHEPTDEGGDYRVIVQPPGAGYRHVVTPAQIRSRLASVPQEFLRGLEVIQLSRMTRKKQSFPCYGMQWGATLYLYPLESTLEEWFTQPPRPEIYNEARMYGGRWDETTPGSWRLSWNQESIEDFYLNNILIHELGHLVDERNSGYAERERFAEWFAIQYGYRATGGSRSRGREVKRRHHVK
jgi:hypothetical protein